MGLAGVPTKTTFRQTAGTQAAPWRTGRTSARWIVEENLPGYRLGERWCAAKVVVNRLTDSF